MHISQSTLDCLKGEFDVEPGEGGSRCDYLEEKGIETYLIIASKPEVKKTAVQNGLNGSVSPLPTDPRPGGAWKGRDSRRGDCRRGGRTERRMETGGGAQISIKVTLRPAGPATRGCLLSEGKLISGGARARNSR